MADPAFARKVNDQWEQEKSEIKKRVEKAKSSFKKNVPDRYVEAMKIYNYYLDYSNEGQWDNAFYCLHLYVACVLGLRLNRPQETGPRYEAQAEEVQDTLNKLQMKMNFCMDGIRQQIIENFRPEEEERRQRELEDQDFEDFRPSATRDSKRPLFSKRSSYSAKHAEMALDALRLDGKKTNVKLYGMEIKKPSASTAPNGPPPPSYNAAVSSSRRSSSGPSMHSTYGRNTNLDDNSGNNFRVKTITGDGNCAFRAIVQGQYNGVLSLDRETRLALQLRRDAADELRRCADEEMTGTGLTVEQLVLMKDDKFPTFNEYVNAMSRNEYAGETEFWLLARKHHMNIAIFKPEGSGYEHLLTYGDADSDPVKLLWRRGRYSEAGNHYDLLLDA